MLKYLGLEFGILMVSHPAWIRIRVSHIVKEKKAMTNYKELLKVEKAAVLLGIPLLYSNDIITPC